jgi:hypothetical protein
MTVAGSAVVTSKRAAFAPASESPVTCTALVPELCSVTIDWAAGVAVPRTPVTTTRSLAKATKPPDDVVAALVPEDVLRLATSVPDVPALVLVPVDARSVESRLELTGLRDDVPELVVFDGPPGPPSPFEFDGAAFPPPPQLQMHAPTSATKESSRPRVAVEDRFNCMSLRFRTG